jgi:hypothetical protein
MGGTKGARSGKHESRERGSKKEKRSDDAWEARMLRELLKKKLRVSEERSVRDERRDKDERKERRDGRDRRDKDERRDRRDKDERRDRKGVDVSKGSRTSKGSGWSRRSKERRGSTAGREERESKVGYGEKEKEWGGSVKVVVEKVKGSLLEEWEGTDYAFEGVKRLSEGEKRWIKLKTLGAWWRKYKGEEQSELEKALRELESKNVLSSKRSGRMWRLSHVTGQGVGLPGGRGRGKRVKGSKGGEGE